MALKKIPHVVAVGLAVSWMLMGKGAASAIDGSGEAETSIERGRYLAIAGNCISCHTADGRAAFSGGMRFETPFGALYSTNITSDPGAGIGGWSRDQFERAMRHGIRADGEHLYPALPFPSFTKIDDADIDALWAYMVTIPPSDYRPPSNELRFPFNQRWLMGLWKSAFFDEGRYEADPGKSSMWNRGAYLVQGLGHCGACHTPRNMFGAERDEKFLTGGSYLDHVAAGKPRQWSAVDLTPSSNGLAAWSREDIESYLRTGHNSRAGTFGPMNEVITNSTRHLTAADIRAMATYLKDLPATAASSEKPTQPEVNAGEIPYTVHCGTCHLPTGLGDVGTGPPLLGSAIVVSEDAASLINVILYGAHVPEETAAQHSWKSMEAFGDKLSDQEVADVSNFIRGSWGNAAPSVKAADVARQR